MIKTELNKYRTILETKQAELELAIRNRDAITIEKSADTLDEIQHAAQRDLAIRTLDLETQILRSIRAALKRINGASYGVCFSCEEDINPKRLNAVPWTPLCIKCQETVDRTKEVDHHQAIIDAA